MVVEAMTKYDYTKPHIKGKMVKTRVAIEIWTEFYKVKLNLVFKFLVNV